MIAPSIDVRVETAYAIVAECRLTSINTLRYWSLRRAFTQYAQLPVWPGESLAHAQ